jgi:hypothetical protein
MRTKNYPIDPAGLYVDDIAMMTILILDHRDMELDKSEKNVAMASRLMRAAQFVDVPRLFAQV